MEKNNFDAYIIPLDEEGRREWISGFTGSNGDCIVTKDKVKFPLIGAPGITLVKSLSIFHPGSII